MRTVLISCMWRTEHLIDVPDDWSVPSTLDGFPEEALEQMEPHNAELVDWE